tara:strand:- start:1086 stop:1238 length:153 start_codon:yes stop_codon:yes gene_type:complete
MVLGVIAGREGPRLGFILGLGITFGFLRALAKAFSNGLNLRLAIPKTFYE